ncbi:MAG: hypothetical protein ABFS35_04820 [Bacteroidota bacterium]
MDKERIKKLAGNPNNIPGIYNYCDRWCERCTFTSRCLNYDISEEQYDSPESKDISNKVFWDKLGEMFKITFEMLEDTMKEQGVEISEQDLEEAGREEEEKREIAKKHDCSKKSMEYTEKVKEWFESSEEFLKAKEIDLNKLGELNLQDENLEESLIRLNDAIEVIHWYQYQIHVKIRRAVSGKAKELKEPEIYKDFPSDADGSAKVALIGMDRSIAAWGELYQQFPEKEDSILDILVMLEKLRKRVEADLPDARAFIRPGFDE